MVYSMRSRTTATTIADSIGAIGSPYLMEEGVGLTESKRQPSQK